MSGLSRDTLTDDASVKTPGHASGAELRREREEAELGQEAVARAMDVSVKTIQRLEKALTVKKRDAAAFRTAVARLLSGDGPGGDERTVGESSPVGYNAAALPDRASARVARLRIHARVAELTDGDEEAEEQAMRIVDRAAEAFSAGGRTQPADDRAIARIIASVGAEVIADLEANNRKAMKR